MLACNKDQAEIAEFNKNCSCAEEVSADFTMEDLASTVPALFDYRTETDTTFEGSYVYFEAKDTNAEYTWYIGSEVIHEKNFTRKMEGSQLIGQQLPMTLVVKKAPNLVCFPNDDGYDSIIKSLTLVDFNSFDYYHNYNHLFEGTFRFKDHLKPGQDSIDVVVELKANGEDGVGYDRALLYGMGHNNTDLELDGTWRITYRQIFFQSGEGYSVQRMHHRMDGIVEIELLKIEGLNDPPPEYHLEGRKL
ncbi:hypothetical protein DNU06_02775 [Putridiphycobacter roseus]|uniref:Uncharacterized protein n=2 Tax=Putridiphycobacter roseus TaxID=2219161 RepID=A0A2W1N597_9FLAO|nr:hypothetical protein DNU06_02775 [Putridiphycobacter roseus]